MIKTEDLRIRAIRPLLAPLSLQQDIPATETALSVVQQARQDITNILQGRDPRLLVIVGPCSVHDTQAALDYARSLSARVTNWAEQLLIVMRVYFEKPRTVVGWKGLINDPDLDESFEINKGLRQARRLLVDISNLGLPCGTEFLDTTFGQFYTDLVSWGAIGARTAESQIHRELASGLSMPVGIKNRTDGDIQVAIDGINAAGHRHLFASLTKEGLPAIYETTGNESAHLILRGGKVTGPNYNRNTVSQAVTMLEEAGLVKRLVVDCSHDNSNKDPTKQTEVVENLASQIEAGSKHIAGVMIESNIHSGNQPYHDKSQLVYGVSITDACLSLEETWPLLERLARAQARASMAEPA
ncbi:MAG: 3-deoxy-7-phosphoheptulonate synthase [Gammaproteobacteria bacterium]|nr:3-deoxy-7-phosphoheptulonate synthase [Gammaproteobacteria bacterium]